MAKVKVLEPTSEVWWASTYQGKVEVDGQVIEFRYAEDPNGVEYYELTENGWEQPDVDVEPHQTVYYLCMECARDIGNEGDEFDFSAEEYM